MITKKVYPIEKVAPIIQQAIKRQFPNKKIKSIEMIFTEEGNKRNMRMNVLEI